MPKKVTKDAAIALAAALILGYLAALAVRDAGKEMGMTAGGILVLGLLVSGATHALPKPKPN